MMERQELPEENVISSSIKSLMGGQSTAAQAYFNFLKSILGIGSVIALPFATSLVGWVWAIILLIPIVYCSIKSNSLLIEVADHINADKMLYADVIRVTLGGIWPYIVDVTIILCQIGVCIAYLIFFVESVISQFAKINIEIGKLQTYAMTLLVIIPLSFIKKIHFFHTTSKYGYYFAIGGLLIMIGDSFYTIAQEEIHLENQFNVMNTFAFVGVAITVCEGIVTILPIRDSMVNKLEFMGVAVSGILTAFIISLIVSLFGVFAFVDVKPIILFNIQNPYGQFTSVVMYCISLLLTYPLQLFPAVQIIEEMIQNAQSHAVVEDAETKARRDNELVTSDPLEIFIRISIMIMIYLIAYQVPHFSHFLNFIGSFFGSMIQYLFPVLAHMYHFRTTEQKQPIVLYVIVLSVCFLAMVLGSLESIGSML